MRARSLAERFPSARSLLIERSGFPEKPVEQRGSRLVDVAVSPAGTRRYQDALHVSFQQLWDGRHVVGPILELILPYPNKLRGRISVCFRADVGRETLLKRFPIVVGDAGLMKEEKQQPFVQVRYLGAAVAQMNRPNFFQCRFPLTAA